MLISDAQRNLIVHYFSASEVSMLYSQHVAVYRTLPSLEGSYLSEEGRNSNIAITKENYGT